jgi:hypothetical protein
MASAIAGLRGRAERWHALCCMEDQAGLGSTALHMDQPV